jgi:Zn-dependent peptidase ImmA (M78 family)/DNA-binding XRE family transcriptional regulator
MNGELVKKAREIQGLTQIELVEVMKPYEITQAAIARIEQNLLEPSEETAKAISMALKFPPEFFYQRSYIDFPSGSTLFRCLKGLRSKDRAQIVQTASIGFQLYSTMAQKLKMKPSRFPKISHKDTYSAPLILRNVLGIEADKPIKQIIKKLENIGVVVISIPLEIHEHDGFSVWIEDRPVIVISRGKSGDRQRRTVVHEMFHLACHYSFVGNNLDEIENEADKLTSEFLLPEEVIRQEIVSPVTLSDLADLKSRWGISIQSLIERAYELEIITTNQRKYLYKQIGEKKWNKVEPRYIEPEQPRAIQMMAEHLYTKNGKVIYSELAKDTKLPRELIHDILSAYKGYTGEPENQLNVINLQSHRFKKEADEEFKEENNQNSKVVNFPF